MNTTIPIDQPHSQSLSYQINRLGFWSAIVVLATGVAAMFIPLDAPGGYAAAHADRIAWLSANSQVFIVGWINQIVAMLALSAVFFGIAWRVVGTNPLRAILAAMVVLLSVMAFIIPKFIAVWTIPVLADTISSGAVGVELADPLLKLLNVSIPFSLYTSFDYLGFWLYAVFALLVAVPLYGNGLAEKVSAVTLGLFGVVYHVMLVAFWSSQIASPDVEVYFLTPSLLLLIATIAMAFHFKNAMASHGR